MSAFGLYMHRSRLLTALLPCYAGELLFTHSEGNEFSLDQLDRAHTLSMRNYLNRMAWLVKYSRDPLRDAPRLR